MRLFARSPTADLKAFSTRHTLSSGSDTATPDIVAIVSSVSDTAAQWLGIPRSAVASFVQRSMLPPTNDRNFEQHCEPHDNRGDGVQCGELIALPLPAMSPVAVMVMPVPTHRAVKQLALLGAEC